MVMQTQEDIVADGVAEEEAALAVESESLAPEEPPDEVTLSNGVRLKLQEVPPFVVRKAASKATRPKPPKYQNNGHEEENPWSPDYQAALKAYEVESSSLGMIALVARGVKSILFIPDGMAKPEEDAWVTDLLDDDIEVDVSTEKRRRLSWLHYVALETQEDIALVGVAAGNLGGIQDAEVAATVANFRNRAQRRADQRRSG